MPATAPISEIMGRRKKAENQLRKLGKELKEAKSHPAWGFFQKKQNPKDFSRFVRETEVSIKQDITMLSFELDQIDSIIRNWEKLGKRARKPRKTKVSRTKANKT